MTFTTPTFLFFLAIVFGLYWSLPRRGQNALLVAGSLLFYGWWDWRFVFLLLFAAGVDYAAALALERCEGPGRRKALLGASLAVNLGTLGLFKYFDFFSASLQTTLAAAGVETEPLLLRLVLPIGISFYTFQALSYTLDVYRGRLWAVSDPVQYLAFITFFPQLVAGPIERASSLLIQFDRERTFDAAQASDGARQMLWGFFKKMVVADTLAVFVADAYGRSGTSGAQLLWATWGFAFQIYCDFSGYTDIAIGCARLFGLRLSRNFAYPYFSRGVPEFWRRWHISLSTWFRDYLYLPLGGSRVGPRRRLANVMLVFAVSGLWHGANWTFVVWGLLHGAFYVLFALFDRGRVEEDVPGAGALLPSFGELARMALTFNLVCFAWVFFRAPSLAQAATVLGRIGGALTSGAFEWPADPSGFFWAGGLVAAEWLQRRRPHALDLSRWQPVPRWAAYYAVVAAILLFASLNYTPFIYFQF